MKKPNRITFVIFSFNEEERIEYPIKCYLPYGNVLVVDNFSTDQTCSIARQLGAKVIQYDNNQHDNIVECREEAEYIFSHIDTEWIFWGYADEMLPVNCLQMFSDIAERNEYKVVVQKLKTMLYRSDMEFLPTYSSIKMFRVGAIDFLPQGKNIHGLGAFATDTKPDDILFLPPIDELAVHHFSVYTTTKLIANHNKYSTIHASLIHSNHLKASVIFQPLLAFLVIYFVQKAFLRGILGFIVAIEYSYYIFQVYAKAYENRNSITLSSIEKNFRTKKESLLCHPVRSSRLDKCLGKIKVSIFSRLYLYKNFKNKKGN